MRGFEMNDGCDRMFTLYPPNSVNLLIQTVSVGKTDLVCLQHDAFHTKCGGCLL